LRGNERRIQGPGRRSADQAGGGAASRTRVLILGLTLIIAAYVLLIARQTARPEREADALRVVGQQQTAQLFAARMEGRIEAARAALTIGASAFAARADRPLDAAEAARAAAPETAFAIVSSTGDVQAASGAPAESFADPLSPEARTPAALRLGVDRRAILTGRAAGAMRIVARIPLPAPAAGEALYLSTPEGVASATPGAAIPAFGHAAVQAATSPVTAWSAGGKPVSLIGAPVGTTGLLAISAQPVSSGGGLLGDIWVLLGPLGLGALVGVVMLLQSWRQRRASRDRAETEHRFRVAVEAARCGVWEWDLEAEEVTLSDYMATLLGLPEGGVVPAATVLARVHPKYHELVEHALRQAATFGAFETTFPVTAVQAGPSAGSTPGVRRAANATKAASSTSSASRWTSPRPAAPRPRPRPPRADCATASRAFRTPSPCSTATAG
jgi:two-component system cell cycle sensor histidine kinase PleC